MTKLPTHLEFLEAEAGDFHRKLVQQIFSYECGKVKLYLQIAFAIYIS